MEQLSNRPDRRIRPAVEADLSGILAIYNDVIATSTAVYTDDPVCIEERRSWLAGRLRQGYPVLVTHEAGSVVGFASFGDFRAWPGYRHTVEHSVHVRQDRRGSGVGRSLVEALIPLAAAMGKHVMIAGVDAANTRSIRFHKHLGFEQVAHFREVGRKFDRWLDLVFLQRFVGQSCRQSPSWKGRQPDLVQLFESIREAECLAASFLSNAQAPRFLERIRPELARASREMTRREHGKM